MNLCQHENPCYYLQYFLYLQKVSDFQSLLLILHWKASISLCVMSESSNTLAVPLVSGALQISSVLSLFCTN